MSQVKNGDTVKIHYTGSLDDGTVFDSSRDSDPLEFTLGASQVIPGFEEGVLGMEVGQSKRVEIEPENAYGDPNPELLFPMPRDQFPDHIEPEIGLQMQMQTAESPPFMVTIVAIEGDIVTLDANHQLAGKKLIFDLEVMGINSASKIITDF